MVPIFIILHHPKFEYQNDRVSEFKYLVFELPLWKQFWVLTCTSPFGPLIMSRLSFFLPLRDKLRDEPLWKTLSVIDIDIESATDVGDASCCHLRFWVAMFDGKLSRYATVCDGEKRPTQLLSSLAPVQRTVDEWRDDDKCLSRTVMMVPTRKEKGQLKPVLWTACVWWSYSKSRLFEDRFQMMHRSMHPCV